MSSPTRKPWDYKQQAKDFHAAHGYNPYLMDWMTTVELEIRDHRLPPLQNVWAAVRYTSTGRLSDRCVDNFPAIKPGEDAPKPLTQADLARMTGRSTSTVSEALQTLRDMGLLLPKSDAVYINDRRQRTLSEEPEQAAEFSTSQPLNPLKQPNHRAHSPNCFAFSSLKKQWDEEHPAEVAQWQQCRQVKLLQDEQMRAIEMRRMAWIKAERRRLKRDARSANGVNGHSERPPSFSATAGYGGGDGAVRDSSCGPSHSTF